MRFSVASALFALVSSAVAQTGEPDAAFNIVNAPAQDQEVSTGSTFTVKWTLGSKAGSGKVKLILVGGKDFATLQPKGTIASGVDNSALSYDWTVDAKFAGEPSYGIQFVDESNPALWQWSKNFKIVGGSSSGNSSSSTTAAPTTSSAAPSTTKAPSTTVKPTGHTNSTIITSTTAAPVPSGNGTAPSPTAPVPGAGIQGAAINAAALIGGLAVAVFAL